MITGSRSQGGSTITQQLARVYFLTRERTFIRKAKELFLAVQIENEFTKEEILSLYLNKIFLGQRSYGVGAAAEVYFGKSLPDVTIAEAATIAGLPKAPSTLNPVSNVERATERRAYVLRRMFELGYIDEAEYEEAAASPVESHLYGPKVELEAPYVTEMVRAEMVRRFGLEAYTAGYKVVTTIDSRLQRAAESALRTALLEYDRRHGFRGPVARGALDEILAGATSEARATRDDEDEVSDDIPAAPVEPITDPTQLDDAALTRLLSVYPSRKDLYIAVVLATGEDNSAEMFIRGIGRVTVPWDNIRWRPYINDDVIGGAPPEIGKMLASGDLVYMLHTADKGWRLAQMPQVQGAFVALDPIDGATVALTGGFDFYASKFNRAVQTRRQPGSSFKPFIYSAALENGFTAATLVNDAPVVFDDSALGNGLAAGKLLPAFPRPDAPARGAGQVAEPGFGANTARYRAGTRDRAHRTVRTSGERIAARPVPRPRQRRRVTVGHRRRLRDVRERRLSRRALPDRPRPRRREPGHTGNDAENRMPRLRRSTPRPGN